jgi:four helix bundle protein
VWQSAKKLALEVYRITARFPDDELYGLRSQLRRAAVSVPSNISEGAARNSNADFLRFLYTARGSINEVDTQLEIADELDYLAAADLTELRQHFDDTSAQLQGLIRHLRKKKAAKK